MQNRDESIEAILCRNVISHTDTEGIKRIIKEIKRVLKINGECYLTLESKSTWGFYEKKDKTYSSYHYHVLVKKYRNKKERKMK